MRTSEKLFYLLILFLLVQYGCGLDETEGDKQDLPDMVQESDFMTLDTICIVSWNMKNMFSVSDVRDREADLMDFKMALNPDIVLLQEFTSGDVLEEIRNCMGLIDFHLVSSDFSGGTGYNSFEVGVLSRFPLSDFSEYDPVPDGSVNEEELYALDSYGIADVNTVRGFLCVRIDVLNLFLIPVHLKSSGGETGVSDSVNAQKREKISALVAETVAEAKSLYPDYYFLTGGDFNVGHSDTLKNGTILLSDCYSNCNAMDLYDETHALLGNGLVRNLRMLNISKEITESTFPTFPGSPIDNFYIDGPDQAAFSKAVRSMDTYGSDHTPISTEFMAGKLMYH